MGQTIGDMVDAPMMETEHIYEAVNYRLLDRRYWNR